jgi:hypothetical protein
MATDRYSDDHKIVVGNGSGTLTIDANLNVNTNLVASNISASSISSENDVTISSDEDVIIVANSGVVDVNGVQFSSDTTSANRDLIETTGTIRWKSGNAQTDWYFQSDTRFNFYTDDLVTNYDLDINTDDFRVNSQDDIYLRGGQGAGTSCTLWLSPNGDSTPYIEMLKSTDRINIYGGTSNISVYSGAVYANAGGDAYLSIGSETILMTGNHPAGGAGIDEQVVDIFNAANNNNADVLYLSIGYTSDATSGNNFIVFFDHGLGVRDIGSIEGDGSGGINLNSGSADYAEWLEIADTEEWQDLLIEGYQNVLGIKEGVLVWIRDSKIHRYGGGTPRIITKRAIVTGNSPRGDSRKKEDGSLIVGEKVSFIGQVPTLVEGAVYDGWYLIPKDGDNCCIAISPSSISFDQYKTCIGTAWETNVSEEKKLVNCAIGVK